MKVGIQMYSVREMIAADAVKAFETVAGIGYKCWEVCQLYGRTDVAWNYGLQMPPQEANELLARLGVEVVGSHLTEDQTHDEEYLEKYLSYMEQIGCKAAGLGSSFFPYMDFDGVKAIAEHFNHVGRLCKKHGMRFYYHNHCMEFQHFGDKTVYDLLMEYTDPELVSFELDTFWCMRGGADPIEVMKKYAGRILFIHQKDFPKNYPTPMNLFEFAIDEHKPLTRESFMAVNQPDAFVEVGTGCMPIQEILNVANETGVQCCILEQDRTTLGEENSIRLSMDAFKRYDGIEWKK